MALIQSYATRFVHFVVRKYIKERPFMTYKFSLRSIILSLFRKNIFHYGLS